MRRSVSPLSKGVVDGADECVGVEEQNLNVEEAPEPLEEAGELVQTHALNLGPVQSEGRPSSK